MGSSWHHSFCILVHIERAMSVDGVERAEAMEDILADFEHNLGKPVLGPGIIWDNLFVLVVFRVLMAVQGALL